MVIGKGFTDRALTGDEILAIMHESLESISPDGKRVLVIIPDGTRSMPMVMMFDLFERLLSSRVQALDYLVALGTHQPMSDAQLSRLIGRAVINGMTGNTCIFNHEWNRPETFTWIGTITAGEISQITNGLMSQEVPIKLNRLIFNYDQLIICGPVFPHEVVGFSGGNKYLFPGIAGAEIINFTHWLGAVITNFQIIGKSSTPVREVIDQAAAFVDRPIACFGLVTTQHELAGLFFGSAREAWHAAATLSAQKHIIYVNKPFQRVLSIMPEMYDDLWTAAKGMYKMEPAIADGGEVIIYAPHINEVSFTHGKLLDVIGYHCRDYFIKQWDKFKDFPGGVLAHSTHLKGLGEYDALTGKESPRIQVTLATRISADRCRKINLGYLDPAEVNIAEWQNREDEGLLVVPRAGEMLYRVSPNVTVGM